MTKLSPSTPFSKSISSLEILTVGYGRIRRPAGTKPPKGQEEREGTMKKKRELRDLKDEKRVLIKMEFKWFEEWLALDSSTDLGFYLLGNCSLGFHHFPAWLA